MEIDLSGTMLTKGHSHLIMMKVDLYKNLNEGRLLEIIAENRKNMYIDDYPGLRGDSQINYAAARHVLKLKWS